jgi:hypothetical protein
MTDFKKEGQYLDREQLKGQSGESIINPAWGEDERALL